MSRKTRRAQLLAGMVDEGVAPVSADSTMAKDMPSPANPVQVDSAMSQKLSVDPQVGAKQLTPLPASLDRPSTSAAQVESIQARAEPSVGDGGEAGVWWFGTPNYSDIAPWWSRQRDSDLRAFVQTEGNDILQSCIGSMVKKFKSMSWVLEGPEAKDKLDPEPGTVDYHQRVLSQAEFGEGWGELLTKSLQDYFSQDQGSYWELTGPGNPSGPLQSCPTGVECLDAQYVQPTGDPAYPILFHDVKRYRCMTPGCGGSSSSAIACPICSGPMQPTPHKVHASRMVHLVDLRSPNQQMNGVGFSAVSRVISSSQILRVRLNPQAHVGEMLQLLLNYQPDGHPFIVVPVVFGRDAALTGPFQERFWHAPVYRCTHCLIKLVGVNHAGPERTEGGMDGGGVGGEGFGCISDEG